MQTLLLLLAATISSAASAAEVTLYNASLGTVPNQQGWWSISNGGTPQISHTGTATRLDTTADDTIQSGYFSEHPLFGFPQHPLMPTLDRDLGFAIDFNLQVISENHANRDDNDDGLLDRAGFSLIAISDDLFGIEIAFFADRIWAYDQVDVNGTDKFVQAEYVLSDTSDMTNYRLVGSSSGYTLFADGAGVLAGAWRQYDGSTLYPYDNPSSLFFGDDTTSASSEVLLGDISVTTGPLPSPTPVPIPLPIPVLMLAAGLVLYRIRPQA